MNERRNIRLLPIHVANKIAAGEVVDRPASVLKELMENAVDAGVTQLDVEIVAGGRKLVSVTDNGTGMNRDNALLSVERQATSKILDVDDIEHIGTLGFRGEALAAIASVSRFRLTTCDKDEDVGTELVISAGKIQDVRDVGCPAGTRIEVRDLFFNVPARRKFLRSHQTELTHIRSCFIVQALAHPEIGMSLTVDNRELYRLPGGDELGGRVRELFGSEYSHKLKSVDFDGGEVSVEGVVSLPAYSRNDRNEQYVFVNGRATSAPVISYAIKEGYHTLLPHDRHPSVFLFLTMDTGLVDVNVHPTKKEVRFRHPSEVRDAVINAVRDALGNHPDEDAQAAVEGPFGKTFIKSNEKEDIGPVLPIEDLPPLHAFRYPRIPGSSTEQAFGSAAPETESAEGSGFNVESSDDTSVSSGPWAWCRVLGQIGSLYVVLETEDGYALMDPHAAHERVLYERFMKVYKDGNIASQGLLVPETVDLSPDDAQKVRRNLTLFKEMGFGIAEFGGDSFVIDSLPICFSGLHPADLLNEVANHLDSAGCGGKSRMKEDSITQAACKAAVKARDKLSLEEIERLVQDLAVCEMPYTCPHGRPTIVFNSFRDVHKLFNRI